MKVILNKTYGGWSFINIKFYEQYCTNKGLPLFWYNIKGDMAYKLPEGIQGDYAFTKDFGVKLYKKNLEWDYWLYLNSEYRYDPVLIELVEKDNGDFDTQGTKLRVVDIPDDLDFVIEDYDGIETLHERVKVW